MGGGTRKSEVLRRKTRKRQSCKRNIQEEWGAAKAVGVAGDSV